MKILPLHAKKGGVVSDLIGGTANLIILVVIALVIVSTLLGANLLGTSANAENTTAGNLSANFTAGINNVAVKIPTILLISAVVLLFGVLVLLVVQARRMGIGGGGSL